MKSRKNLTFLKLKAVTDKLLKRFLNHIKSIVLALQLQLKQLIDF